VPPSSGPRPFPVHHLLLALAPVLFLYSHNAAKLPIAPAELLLPLAMSFSVALGLWLLLWALMRSSRRAALVVSLFLILFFLYGRAQGIIGSEAKPALLPVSAAIILLPGILYFARPRREFSGLTIFLNLASLALVLMNLVTGVPSLVRWWTPRVSTAVTAESKTTNLPDIYYIIFDTYTRGDVLKQPYGYDNSGFIDYLRSKGFLVGSHSRSNYAQTYLSLASSLNLTYLDSVARRAGTASDDHSPLLEMIAHNRVRNFLQQHGYRMVSFASGYNGTEFKDADVHYAPRWALSEFQNVLISTTALPAMLKLVARRSQWDAQRQLILYAIERLPDVAEMRPPIFAFAHIVCPHPPFVFGPHGEKLNPSEVYTLDDENAAPIINKQTMRQDYMKSFRDQSEFVTFKARQMIDRILARSSRPPIIIVQGDHGPAAFRSWDDVDTEQLRERMCILNAYIIPKDSTGPAWYDSISPVNTFRLILDRVFGESLPLLPDRSWFSTIMQPYRFYDVDHPEAYERARRLRNAPLAVLVYAAKGSTAPADTDVYARKLVRIRYYSGDRRVAGAYLRCLPPDSLSVPAALAAYKSAVKARDLPDLGQEPDSYSGPGPNHKPVVALFFVDTLNANR